MAKAKRVEDDPEHRQGNRCGYTLKPDGRIIPAPMYSQQFEQLSMQRSGINDLMKLFSSHCADLLSEIQRRQNQIWNDLCEDYGLNQETHDMKFDGKYLTLTPKAPPAPSANPPQFSSTEGDRNG